MSRSRSRPGPGQRPAPRPWLVLASYDAQTKSRQILRATFAVASPALQGDHETAMCVDVDAIERGVLPHGTRLRHDVARWFVGAREVDRRAFLVAARGAA